MMSYTRENVVIKFIRTLKSKKTKQIKKFTSDDLFPGSGEYSVYLLLSAAQQGMQEPK